MEETYLITYKTGRTQVSSGPISFFNDEGHIIDQAVHSQALVNASEVQSIVKKTELSCSFCGKDSYSVEQLVKGLHRAFICNECITFFRES